MISIYTDGSSRGNPGPGGYGVVLIKKWVFGWEKKNYTVKKNPDLWMRFLRIYRKHHVKFVWVKGHATNAENNRCDELAVAAAMQSKLKVDVEYERVS